MRRIPLEATIESHLVSACKSEGFEAVKMSIPGRRGWPDRMVIGDASTCCPHCGRPAVEFVELKRSIKHAMTKLQKYLAGLLRKRGFHVEVVHSKAEVKEYIESFKVRSKAVSD